MFSFFNSKKYSRVLGVGCLVALLAVIFLAYLQPGVTLNVATLLQMCGLR